MRRAEKRERESREAKRERERGQKGPREAQEAFWVHPQVKRNINDEKKMRVSRGDFLGGVTKGGLWV